MQRHRRHSKQLFSKENLSLSECERCFWLFMWVQHALLIKRANFAASYSSNCPSPSGGTPGRANHAVTHAPCTRVCSNNQACTQTHPSNARGASKRRLDSANNETQTNHLVFRSSHYHSITQPLLRVTGYCKNTFVFLKN